MKQKVLSVATLLIMVISCGKGDSNTVTGCMDHTASNYNASANVNCSACCTYPQGGVLFYLTDPSVLARCGPVTVTLSNGQQTTINGYYPGVPANCINMVGGYLLVNAGTYSYTITSGGCGVANGTITVVEGCNKFHI